MQRSDFRHWIKLPTRWGDMDALGHVNNVEFFRFFESGRIAYVDALSHGEVLSNNTVLANIDCAFLQQLHYPQIIDVATRAAKIGNSSLSLECALFVEGEAKPAAKALAIIVWYDFAEARSTRIPDTVRTAITRFENIAPAQT